MSNVDVESAPPLRDIEIRHRHSTFDIISIDSMSHVDVEYRCRVVEMWNCIGISKYASKYISLYACLYYIHSMKDIMDTIFHKWKR